MPEHCLYALWRLEHLRLQVRASQAGQRYFGGDSLQKGQRSERRAVSVVGVIEAVDWGLRSKAVDMVGEM